MVGLGDQMVNYLLFLPPEYGDDPQRRWPLMVFLHGVAKRGDTLEDLRLLKRDGPPMIVEEERNFPFVVLSPQCPSDSYWPLELSKVEQLLDHVVGTYALDADRLILTGLSMGGYGVWHWALRDPIRFAAVAPIAGGYEHGSDVVPDNICDIKDLPIWVFHGGADEAVLPKQSEILVDALKACGSLVRFTVYPGASHAQSWKQAYADPALYEWMLAQKRSAKS
jgi:predicted peptidase